MNKKDFGWCFIGSGSIAERVTDDLLKYANGSYPAAVYSKTYANAQLFAGKYGAVAYKSAKEALLDPYVKGAYICTTHPYHKEYSVMALNMGIPVVCEKPMAMNAAEAKAMIDAANKNDTYLMEAMWMCHNPVIKQVIKCIDQGRIGKICSLSASFSTSSMYDSESRLFDPRKGGGALLDVGVYTVALAQAVFRDMPVSVKADADLAPTGVDCVNAMIFKYADGAIARLFSATIADEPSHAYIAGQNGHIYIPKFWAPKKAVLSVKGKPEEILEGNFDGEGFQFEFDAAKEDILAGRKENKLISHEFTLKVMELLDTAHAEF